MRVVMLVLAGLLLVGAAASEARATAGCPLSFTATPSGPGTVVFHWSGFGGADGYQVFGYEGQGSTAGYSPMLSGDARDHTTTNISAGSYTFWVDAFHGDSLVASSCHVTASVTSGLTMACPTNLTAAAGVDAVGLHWDAIPGAGGYRIARAVDAGAWDDNFASTDTTSFTDTDVTAGGSYSYRVVSDDTRSPPAACASVTAVVPGAHVPFFPSAWSFGLAGAGACIAVAFVVVRRRR